MDYSKITLGELLSSDDETIRRNATSILKNMQRKKEKEDKDANRIEKDKINRWGINL